MLPFEVTTGALPLSAGLVSMTLPEASVTVSISVDSAEASSLEASAGVLSSATVLFASAELSEGCGIAVVLVALARREREYHREDKKQGSDLQKILFHVKNLS